MAHDWDQTDLFCKATEAWQYTLLGLERILVILVSIISCEQREEMTKKGSKNSGMRARINLSLSPGCRQWISCSAESLVASEGRWMEASNRQSVKYIVGTWISYRLWTVGVDPLSFHAMTHSCLLDCHCTGMRMQHWRVLVNVNPNNRHALVRHTTAFDWFLNWEHLQGRYNAIQGQFGQHTLVAVTPAQKRDSIWEDLWNEQWRQRTLEIYIYIYIYNCDRSTRSKGKQERMCSQECKPRDFENI